MGLNYKESEVGIIPKDWEIVTMEEALEKIIDYRGKTPKKSDSGILTLSAKSVKNGYIDYSSAYFISEKTYEEFMVRGMPKIGDILLTTEAPLGYVARLDRDDIGLAQRLLTLRGKKDYLYNDYLRYYLMSPVGQHQLKARESGTTVTGIKQSEFRKALIPIPPYKEQKAIGHVLSTLDEKIKTNNQINEKLEEMAQALFKHWFVDFEFPNENGEPYKSSGGEMVESELGMIPKGWGVGKLGDIISISSGKRPKEKQADSSEKYPFPIVGASSIMGYTSDFNYNEPVLIIGRVGTHGIIQRFTNKVWASDNTLVIKSKYYGFTYNILKSIDYKSLNRGSTQPLITQKDIKNTTVLIPPSNVVNSYEDFYSSLFEKYRTNKVESDLLTKIRDSILPKLMSGEIRVPLDDEVLSEKN